VAFRGERKGQGDATNTPVHGRFRAGGNRPGIHAGFFSQFTICTKQARLRAFSARGFSPWVATKRSPVNGADTTYPTMPFLTRRKRRAQYRLRRKGA